MHAADDAAVQSQFSAYGKRYIVHVLHNITIFIEINIENVV